MAVLERKTTYEHLDISDPAFQELSSIVISGKASSPQAERLRAFFFSASCPLSLKIGLSYFLFEVTKDNRWKAQLRAVGTQDLEALLREHRIFTRKDAEPGFTLLADKSIFSADERASELQELYQSRPDRSYTDRRLTYIFVGFSPDALVKFREPWLDYLKSQVEYPLEAGHDIYDEPSLANLSPEAFAIKAISEVDELLYGSPLVIEYRPDPIVAPQKCSLPTSLPLCKDFVPGRNANETGSHIRPGTPSMSEFVIPLSRKPAYEDWLKFNANLVRLWLSRDQEGLRQLPDATFAKILAKQWIE